MRLDLYLRETATIARAQTALLDEARERLLAGSPLSRLEENGVLHALQVLMENAIGKAKQTLKARGEQVPVSGYDCFSSLALSDASVAANMDAWAAAIGLRNRIVHNYMNLDMRQVLGLVREERYRLITEFLLEAIRV
jgi:uncharacterized protein YutE (UPF0331/DUF86 family)